METVTSTRVDLTKFAWLSIAAALATITLKNGEGNYQASPETLKKLEDNDQVVFRYLDNPNGSANDIAGITNERGNVVGLMPHPEHNV